MQYPQDNFFYQSYSRFSTQGENDERQLLVKQQRLSHARTRRFALETKQRRKALEEKQKQWDIEEKQQRDSILQQRKQQVQEVTERFQRAYLPPSNRRRQSVSQGFFSQSSSTSSHMSINSRHSRSLNPTPRPPSAPKPFQRPALKLAPERDIFPKSDQEDETTSETPQHPSPQDTHGSTSSDSISSKDSLEVEDPDPSPPTHSTSHLDPEKLHPNLREQSDATPVSDLTLSPMWLLGEAQNSGQRDDAECTDDYLPGFKASWGFTLGQETGPDLNELDNIDQEHFEMNSHPNNPKDNTSLSNRVALDYDPSCLNQEPVLDPRQEHVHDETLLKHAEMDSLSKDSNSEQVTSGSPPKPNIFRNDNPYDFLDDRAPVQTGEENHHLSSHKELSASINNLNNFLNSEVKPLLQQAPLFNIHGDTQSSEEEEVVQEQGEEEEEEEEDEERAPPLIPEREVRIIKGILKKPPMGIKDSVELTRARLSDSESGVIQKKRVRWLDEVHQENSNWEDTKDKYPMLPKKSPEYHQPAFTSVSGFPKSSPGLTPAAFSSYHFTKQAWADVGVQRLQSANRSGGHLMSWREHAARGAVAPVPPRARKGTVMRPQSATAVTQIAKTQGRVVVPRPPPRTEMVTEDKMVARTPYGTDHPNCKQSAAAELGEHRDTFYSPYHVSRADSSSLVYSLLSPPYASPASEDNAKSKLCIGQQESQGSSSRRRALSEKGLCLGSTPTDEDISQLWHGVRSVLVTKDAKAGVRRPTSEGGRVLRRPGAEQSRQPSLGSGNRRPPPAKPPHPVKGSMEPIRKFLNKHNVVCTHEGLASAAQLHLAEGPAAGRREERDHKAAMETAQTLSPGMVPRQQQQQQQQAGPTSLSMEEKKILMSLDRLDHRLLCVQKNSESSTPGPVLINAALVKETKVALGPSRHRASSVNNRIRHPKKS